MTSAQRTTYHIQYLRWHTQQERIAVRIILTHFRRIADHVSTNLEHAGIAGVSAMLDRLVPDSDYHRLLESIYLQVGVRAAQREYTRLLPVKSTGIGVMRTKDRDPLIIPNVAQKPLGGDLLTVGRYSTVWRNKLIELTSNSATAQRVTKMAALAKQQIRDVLTRGVSEMWDIRKVAKKLRAVIVDKSRAMLIARTETTRAANAGHEFGAQSTLLKLDKIWISTNDLRTRPAHLEAGKGKPIGKDAKFIVDGLPMDYPGDPAGGAGNVCNCRCCVAYVPSKGFLGLN